MKKRLRKKTKEERLWDLISSVSSPVKLAAVSRNSAGRMGRKKYFRHLKHKGMEKTIETLP